MTYGNIGNKATPRELAAAILAAIAADPTNSVWDEPLDINSDGVTAYKFAVEDVTDSCDGSCQHPQCVYALDVTTKGGMGAGYDAGTGDIPKGYTDEGLHYVPVLWTSAN